MEKEIKDLRNDLISFGLKCATSEAVERMIYKNGDEIAVSIARSFERLEERIDALESRMYSRMSEVEDAVKETQESIHMSLAEIKSMAANK